MNTEYPTILSAKPAPLRFTVLTPVAPESSVPFGKYTLKGNRLSPTTKVFGYYVPLEETRKFIDLPTGESVGRYAEDQAADLVGGLILSVEPAAKEPGDETSLASACLYIWLREKEGALDYARVHRADVFDAVTGEKVTA